MRKVGVDPCKIIPVSFVAQYSKENKTEKSYSSIRQILQNCSKSVPEMGLKIVPETVLKLTSKIVSEIVHGIVPYCLSIADFLLNEGQQDDKNYRLLRLH